MQKTVVDQACLGDIHIPRGQLLHKLYLFSKSDHVGVGRPKIPKKLTSWLMYDPFAHTLELEYIQKNLDIPT